MKVYKPLRLGYLSRVTVHAGRPRLSVALLSYFPFEAPRRIGLEQDMWQEIMPVLGNRILDPCDAKPRGEVLVYGTCHVPGGAPAGSAQVRLQVSDAIDKRLRVTGRREWLRGPTGRLHASAPVPFTRLELDWAHAYGGPDCPDNPDGIGHWGRPDGRERFPLPCIEYPDEPMSLPDDRIRPAALTPRPLTLPARQKLAGTYDDHWFRHHHPGYPQDIRPEFFLTAAPDQVLPGFLEGRERFRLEGMHPRHPVLAGQLPGLRARCFVERKAAGEPAGTAPPFEEVPLHADTLLLFPELERAILIHHGSVAVETLDGLDLGYLIAGFEWQEDAPRPAAHWHGALERRRDPAGGALALLATDDVCPLGWVEPTLEAARTIRPMRVRDNPGVPPRLTKLFDRARAKAQSSLKAAGLEPPKPPAVAAEEPPELKEILAECEALKAMPLTSQAEGAAFNAQMNRIAEKVRRLADGETGAAFQAARSLATRFGYDFDQLRQDALTEARSDPEDLAARFVQGLRRGDHLLPPEQRGALAGRLPPDLAADMSGPLSDAADEIAAARREGAHLMPPPALLPATRQAAKARMLAAAAASGSPPVDTTMSGLDLSGRRLDGMNLSGVDMTGSRFVGASLVGARLEGAGLAHADLSRANLSGAGLAGANLNKAGLDGAIFAGADLTGLTMTGVAAKDLSFREARLAGIRFVDAGLPKAGFAGADLTGAMFDRCDLSGADFRGARFGSTTFAACSLAGARFDGATGAGLLLLNCKAPGARFTGCSLSRLTVGGSTVLDGADLSGCTLPGCNLSMASLKGASLADSDLHGGNLMQSDLTGATLSGSNLRGAVMMHADLTGTRMEGTDAMQANLLHATFAETQLRGANLYGANLMRATFRDTELAQANLTRTQLDHSNAP